MPHHGDEGDEDRPSAKLMLVGGKLVVVKDSGPVLPENESTEASRAPAGDGSARAAPSADAAAVIMAEVDSLPQPSLATAQSTKKPVKSAKSSRRADAAKAPKPLVTKPPKVVKPNSRVKTQAQVSGSPKQAPPQAGSSEAMLPMKRRSPARKGARKKVCLTSREAADSKHQDDDTTSTPVTLTVRPDRRAKSKSTPSSPGPVSKATPVGDNSSDLVEPNSAVGEYQNADTGSPVIHDATAASLRRGRTPPARTTRTTATRARSVPPRGAERSPSSARTPRRSKSVRRSTRYGAELDQPLATPNRGKENRMAASSTPVGLMIEKGSSAAAAAEARNSDENGTSKGEDLEDRGSSNPMVSPSGSVRPGDGNLEWKAGDAGRPRLRPRGKDEGSDTPRTRSSRRLAREAATARAMVAEGHDADEPATADPGEAGRAVGEALLKAAAKQGGAGLKQEEPVSRSRKLGSGKLAIRGKSKGSRKSVSPGRKRAQRQDKQELEEPSDCPEATVASETGTDEPAADAAADEMAEIDVPAENAGGRRGRSKSAEPSRRSNKLGDGKLSLRGKRKPPKAARSPARAQRQQVAERSPSVAVGASSRSSIRTEMEDEDGAAAAKEMTGVGEAESGAPREQGTADNPPKRKRRPSTRMLALLGEDVTPKRARSSPRSKRQQQQKDLQRVPELLPPTEEAASDSAVLVDAEAAVSANHVDDKSRDVMEDGDGKLVESQESKAEVLPPEARESKSGMLAPEVAKGLASEKGPSSAEKQVIEELSPPPSHSSKGAASSLAKAEDERLAPIFRQRPSATTAKQAAKQSKSPPAVLKTTAPGATAVTTAKKPAPPPDFPTPPSNGKLAPLFLKAAPASKRKPSPGEEPELASDKGSLLGPSPELAVVGKPKAPQQRDDCGAKGKSPGRKGGGKGAARSKVKAGTEAVSTRSAVVQEKPKKASRGRGKGKGGGSGGGSCNGDGGGGGCEDASVGGKQSVLAFGTNGDAEMQVMEIQDDSNDDGDDEVTTVAVINHVPQLGVEHKDGGQPGAAEALGMALENSEGEVADVGVNRKASSSRRCTEKKGMTDDELLSAPQMFLTKDQRKRKEQLRKDEAKKRREIEAAHKVLSDRAKRDSWAHAGSIPVDFNAEEASSSSARDENRDEDGDVEAVGVTAGSSALKRPKCFAPIFDRSARAAAASLRGGAAASASAAPGTASGQRGDDPSSWKAMLAPFPVDRHHFALALSSSTSTSRSAEAGMDEPMNAGVASKAEGVECKAEQQQDAVDNQRVGDSMEGDANLECSCSACFAADATQSPAWLPTVRPGGLPPVSIGNASGESSRDGPAEAPGNDGAEQAMLQALESEVAQHRRGDRGPEPTPEEAFAWKHAVMSHADARAADKLGTDRASVMMPLQSISVLFAGGEAPTTMESDEAPGKTAAVAGCDGASDGIASKQWVSTPSEAISKNPSHQRRASSKGNSDADAKPAASPKLVDVADATATTTLLCSAGKLSSRVERTARTALARRAEAPPEALWTEVYRPRTPEEVCGNSRTLSALSRWLAEWKERRRRHAPEDAERSRVGKHCGSDGDESDGEWDYRDCSDDGGESELCNMTLICGPSGVGKTSAVYGCAKGLGYEVIEVNPCQLRSGAAIRRLFGEAAQSHHVSTDGKSPRHAAGDGPEASMGGLHRFTKCSGKGSGRGRGRGRGGRGGTKAAKRSGNGRGRDAPSDAVVRAPSKLSIILFEEVDVVFEEDVGFLGALKDLRRRAKCPIVLTAEFYRQDYKPLTCNVLYMPRPRLAELEVCLSAIAAAEGMELSSSALCALAKFHMGDLRACLLTLQACKGRCQPCKEHANSSSKPWTGGERKEVLAGFKPCSQKLAEYVHGDAAVSHYLRFDTFLPSLVEADGRHERGMVSAVNDDGEVVRGDECGKKGAAAAVSKGLMKEGSKLGDADATIDAAEAEDEQERSLFMPKANGRGPWHPPHLHRWPEVSAVSPSSVRVDIPTSAPSSKELKVTGQASSDLDAWVVGDKGSKEDGTRALKVGHRVLISGKNFAHPVPQSGSASVPSLNAAAEANDREGACCVLTSTGKELPVNGGQETIAAGPKRPVREVFVRFGRDVVPGKVLSDQLVEAYAPPRAEPGFVDVVVVVAGEGAGGHLASDSGLSEGECGSRHSVLFRYCPPPPSFPPVDRRRGARSRGAGPKLQRGKRRRATGSTERDSRTAPNPTGRLLSGDKGADDNQSGSPVFYGRYGPICDAEPSGGSEKELDGAVNDGASRVAMGGGIDSSDVSEVETSRYRRGSRGLSSCTTGSSDCEVNWNGDGDEAEAEAGGDTPREVEVRVVEGGTGGLAQKALGDTESSDEAEVQAPSKAELGPRKKRRFVVTEDCDSAEEAGEEHGAGATTQSVCNDTPMDDASPDGAGEEEPGTCVDGTGGVSASTSGRDDTIDEQIPSIASDSASANCDTGAQTAAVELDAPQATNSATVTSGNAESGASCAVDDSAVMDVVADPYELPTAAEAARERASASRVQATFELTEAFSAADAIGGICARRGFDGIGAPPAQGGDDFVTAGGRPWPRHDPKVLSRFVEDETRAGPGVNSESLPRALMNGACTRYQAMDNQKAACGHVEASFEAASSSAESPGRLAGSSDAASGVQAKALRGHCLSYCQRDRLDYIVSRTALTKEPLRARGPAVLAGSLTLDRAPALANMCAIEESRQEGVPTGVGIGEGDGRDASHARRGPGHGRFRHYLVKTGVVDGLVEAHGLGRMYEEPAW